MDDRRMGYSPACDPMHCEAEVEDYPLGVPLRVCAEWQAQHSAGVIALDTKARLGALVLQTMQCMTQQDQRTYKVSLSTYRLDLASQRGRSAGGEVVK